MLMQLLRLTLEDWLLYVQGYGSNDTITDVAILILAIELLDGLGDMLLERRGASLRESDED